jgi:hypothetical protein
VSSATSGDGQDNGLIGDAVNWFGDKFKDGLVQFGIWFAKGLFYITQPFIQWGCKSVIVASIVTYYCSHDPKSIRIGLKFFFIYLAYNMIRSALQ